MSLLFLSAISIALFSVSATGAPSCSPEALPVGCATTCSRGASSTAAVWALAAAPQSNAPHGKASVAPRTHTIIFSILPLLPTKPALASNSPRSSNVSGEKTKFPSGHKTLEGRHFGRPMPSDEMSRTQLQSALFIPQRLDRLQLSRLVRRQISKKKSRRTRHHKRQHHAHRGHRHAQVSRQEKLSDHRHEQPDQNPHHRTAPADQKRFRQKLIHDLLARRPNCLSNPDLPRPLRHRHQHDVHNPYPADEQRDERNHDQHNRQRQ